MCLNVHTSHYWMTYLTNTIDCDVSECPYIPLLDDIFDEHNRLWCVWMSIHPITGWHIWRTQLIVMCLNIHASHYWMTCLTNTIDCDVAECPYIPLLDDIFEEHNILWCAWMSIHPITGWHIWRTQQVVMCLNVHTTHYWVTYLSNTINCDESECPYIPLLDDIFDEHNRLWCVWMSMHPINGWHIWRTQYIVMCLNVHTSRYWMTYLTNTIDCDVSECAYIPLLDDIFAEHNRLWCVWMSIHPVTGWHIWRTQ